MITPTPEAIQAAARALYRDWWNRNEYAAAPDSPDWEAASRYDREMYVIRARAALTAAAPFIAAQAKGEAFQAVRDAAEVEPDQVGDYGMVELPGYLTIDTRAFDALDKDDRERLHITADDYAQAIDDAQAQAKAQAKAEALIAFADAHRMPWTMFNHEGQQVTVGDLLREQAAAYRATIEGKES